MRVVRLPNGGNYAHLCAWSDLDNAWMTLCGHAVFDDKRHDHETKMCRNCEEAERRTYKTCG